LISVLQLNDIDVQRLQWFGEEVQLTAEAENATQALQMILDQPFVSSAQFTSPVRKAQRKEMLTAAIEFRKHSSKGSDTEPAKTTNSETGTEGISND
jgi:phosphoserine phosphatase